MKRIHLLRPGTFSGTDGTAFTFSAANLQAIAANYDPSRGEAPLTVGHPKNDHPAFGWVERLEFDAGNNNLYAVPKQVPAEFASAVERGAFKKISVALFAPGQAANPKPEDYYLRHVGFLGAHVPAVPGLSPIEFAAAEKPAVSIEFSAPGAWSAATLFRRLRDYLISKDGLEAADQALPEYAVGDLEAVARMPDDDQADAATSPPIPAFAAKSQEHQMTTITQADLDARKVELDNQAAQIATDKAALDAREATFAAQAVQARRSAIAGDIDAAIKDGRVLPVERGLMIELSASLEQGKTIEFAAADGTKETINLFERWSAFLKALPSRVSTGEFAGVDGVMAQSTASFAAPSGYTVDPERMELHQKALAHITANPATSYEQAVSIVEAAR